MPLKLPADLALDLHAFCEVHFDAPQSHVIWAALRHFIAAELKEDEVLRARFDVARQRLEGTTDRRLRTGEALRLVDNPTRAGDSEDPSR
jgi:hypothetical protein